MLHRVPQRQIAVPAYFSIQDPFHVIFVAPGCRGGEEVQTELQHFLSPISAYFFIKAG
jgi:hypothetical protein